jgi:hypothetical protein
MCPAAPRPSAKKAECRCVGGFPSDRGREAINMPTNMPTALPDAWLPGAAAMPRAANALPDVFAITAWSLLGLVATLATLPSDPAVLQALLAAG